MIVHCPACSKKMTLPDSASGKTYRCPHCQERLTVPSPVVAEPTPIIQPAETGENRKRSYRRREPMSGQSKLFALVAIMLAIVLGFFIYDRVEAFYLKKRFQALQQEDQELRRKMYQREFIVGPGGVENDAEWKRLGKRQEEVVNELSQMLHDHPELMPLRIVGAAEPNKKNRPLTSEPA